MVFPVFAIGALMKNHESRKEWYGMVRCGTGANNPLKTGYTGITKKGNLPGAQPTISCSFALHLVGKLAILCSFAHHYAPASCLVYNPPNRLKPKFLRKPKKCLEAGVFVDS